MSHAGVHNNFLGAVDSERRLDSGFRRNDERGRSVIPGKAVGRDPESRILLCTRHAEPIASRSNFG
jgi:hypothetical protein